MAIIETESSIAQAPVLKDTAKLWREVETAVNTTAAIDVHTHIFPPEFDELCRYGIDELLTYHYLIAETFRSTTVTPQAFWQMTRAEQADLIWATLFVDNTPMSEATRGIVTILDAFGLDTRSPDLREARAFFRSQDLASHLDRVLDMACVGEVVMTNDPFDENEAPIWAVGGVRDNRFRASLRMDGLLNDWPGAVQSLSGQGFEVEPALGAATCGEVRRFLEKWIRRMDPVYMAVSLPDDFRYPSDDARDRLLREVVLPTAEAHGLAFALMVGVRRGVNPALRSAGDGVGRADVSALERLCGENPDVRFMATFLSLENQHELCVSARKFGNLMPFGCWWFLNNPSLVSDITRERIELLGPSFIPQHSDARVLEQLVYKWRHARSVLVHVLFEAYEKLLTSGRAVTREEIARDVSRLFSGNFRAWLQKS
jgi:hypothetical protein